MNLICFLAFLVASFWFEAIVVVVVADGGGSDECDLTESPDQQQQCFLRHHQKLKILKELKVIGGHRLDPSIKDTSAYLAALKRHRKGLAKDENEPCTFPLCDNDGVVKRMALRVKKGGPKYLPEDSNRIWFNISTLIPYNFEEAAVLYYVGRIKDKYSDRDYQAHFYNYISPTDVHEYAVLSLARKLDNITGMMTVDEKWESFDITALVRNWIDDPEKNYGFMIKLSILHEEDENEELYSEIVAETKPPAYLEISNTHFRVKQKRDNAVAPRKTPICEQGQDHKTTACCLFPFTISFEELNMDWILAPKRVDFYYCAGFCNAASLKKGKINHSSILYAKKPLEMCCAPEVSDPIDFLYQDADGNLQLKTLKNMIVRSCSCS